ncbi:hypothetical protein LAJ19_21100 (plasmid) [Deinococcus taeanensis]|uniref:hypothetical protein n=1 Tax=Deinococcus taeanensis TaxID=2737050 RepID=UPI001CDC5A2D|nr:hypothetical protein [Deinococcus taeanensis]UBV45292.1 hypothetical protein LAJ19_21100 [Deinococcus taeanensis]
MMRHGSVRLCTLSFLLSASSVWPGRAAAPADPQLLKAAATLYAAAAVGAIARDWCLVNAPAERAVIEQGYAAWRVASGLPGIESYLQTSAAPQLPDLRAAVNAQREQVYAELNRASRDPAADCRNIRAQLAAQVNLSVLYPQEYQRTAALRASGVTPARAAAPAASGGGPFLTNTDFAPLSRASVQELLGKAGGQAPYHAGGPLRTGAYDCVGQNTNDFATLLSVVRFTLTLYGDQGLRMTNGTFTDEATRKTTPLKSFQATYRYDRTSGAIEFNTDYANDDLKDYLHSNGRYDGGGDDPPLLNLSRALTDARGQSLIYGQQSFGYRDGRLTVCRFQGEARGLSPVAEAGQAEQAALEQFNRYRLKPNAGLKPGQIEGLLHTFENEYDGINVTGRETTTLLLKDGTAYLNLRWSPHDLDVAASRRGEPQAWTKWRRQGAGYELLQAGRWTSLKGTPGVPGTRSEGLTGTYEFFSAYTSGTLMNGATASTRDVYTFTAGGQFTRASGGGVAGTLNNGFTVTTGAATGPSTLTKGTYVFDGYTLELRGPDGQSSRTYAFYWDRRKNELMIGGRTYSRR